MRKVFLFLLMLTLLPSVMAAGDKFWLHASDGSSYINGTDLCVDVFGSMKCLSDAGTSGGDISSVTAGDGLGGGGTSGAVTLDVNGDTCGAGDFSIYNGSGFECDTPTGNTDEPLWSANLTAHNDSWNLDTDTWNTTLEMQNAAALHSYYNSTNPQPSTEPLWSANLTAHNDTWNQDTTYDAGSNLTLTSTTFSLDTINVLSWLNNFFWDITTALFTTTNITTTGNISGAYIFGDGSQLSNLPVGTEADPFWSANLTAHNDTWNAFVDQNSSITHIGDCPSGQFAQNLTQDGPECTAPAGSGDITAVTTDGPFLTGGVASGDADLLVDGAFLNDTTFTNSLNQTEADLLYSGIGEPLWSANLTAHNASWNFDTNASTACSAGEYLDGGGICPDFNATVQSLIASVQFNASVITTVTGTLDSGDLDSILVSNDGDTYNVSEVTGVPGFDIIMNYTGVDNFNSIIFREWYDGSALHEVSIQLRLCADGSYETHDSISEMDDFGTIVVDIFDSNLHICEGAENNVSLRLLHSASGSAAHDMFIDSAHLFKGAPTASPTEVDPLSIHKDGDVALTANWNQGAFNFTNTQSHFYGTANTSYNWNTSNNGTVVGINVSEFKNVGGLLSIVDGLFGMITSIVAGNGMDFSTITGGAATIVMGTPGTLNAGTANGVSATSHLHAITSATPSDGDTTSFSNADEIFDWGTAAFAPIGEPLAYNGTLAYLADILGWGYYNSTDFVISDYFTQSQVIGFDYYNATNKVPASSVTTGSFGTGDYIMDGNLTVEKLVFENSADHYIEDNSTCTKIYGDTSILEIC